MKKVIAADTSIGFEVSPEVRTCRDFSDDIGHIKDPVKLIIGEKIAAAYA